MFNVFCIAIVAIRFGVQFPSIAAVLGTPTQSILVLAAIWALQKTDENRIAGAIVRAATLSWALRIVVIGLALLSLATPALTVECRQDGSFYYRIDALKRLEKRCTKDSTEVITAFMSLAPQVEIDRDTLKAHRRLVPLKSTVFSYPDGLESPDHIVIAPEVGASLMRRSETAVGRAPFSVTVKSRGRMLGTADWTLDGIVIGAERAAPDLLKQLAETWQQAGGMVKMGDPDPIQLSLEPVEGADFELEFASRTLGTCKAREIIHVPVRGQRFFHVGHPIKYCVDQP